MDYLIFGRKKIVMCLDKPIKEWSASFDTFLPQNVQKNKKLKKEPEYAFMFLIHIFAL